MGDLLATLVSFPPAEIALVCDGKPSAPIQGHVVLVGNTRYVGPHYPMAPEADLSDGLLDLLVFANLTKIDLISGFVQVASGGPEDPRIQRFQAHTVEIITHPAMPVLADGIPIGEGTVRIASLQRALNIMVPQ